ncbi:MAG: hypothetical protein POELPBGB_00551 [Bacteroidia bacterium]|nr:hypothetical protein [Bacteroidia bacterium]
MKKLLTVLLVFISGWCVGQDQRIWATYYGGTDIDISYRVATDVSNNVYLAGMSNSIEDIASGGFQNTYGGGSYDAYLVKFDSAGNRHWATYYGGTGYEEGYSVATDAFGNVYLTGRTSSVSDIASDGCFQNNIGGLTDVFLVKFDSLGTRLWATYYGGSDNDYVYSVSCDIWGNIYLTGWTESTSDFSWNGFQNTFGGEMDAFLVKFDSIGNRIWATYYGGAETDIGESLAIDGNGNVYLAGYTGSTSSIAFGGFHNNYGGDDYDAFLAKFDSTGNRLWATYYGGGGVDMSRSVAIDALDNVYLGGVTMSNSAIASGGFQNIYGGNRDVFLVKFDSLGNRLWATYYGGMLEEDESGRVSIDINGNIYLAGMTYSSDNIASNGFQNNLTGIENQFFVKFDSSGNRLCATYYGQNHEEDVYIALDLLGNIYLSGSTQSLSGITSGGFQNDFGGGSVDAFLVKFTSCDNSKPTGIEMAASSYFTLYPNPATTTLTLTTEQTLKNAELKIMNAIGQELSHPLSRGGCASLGAGKGCVIDISHLPTGLYYLTLQSNEGVATKKFEVIR